MGSNLSNGIIIDAFGFGVAGYSSSDEAANRGADVLPDGHDRPEWTAF
jgi:hypothetical protein